MPVKTTSSNVVVPSPWLLRSHRTFPRTRIVRRKRLRDLNLDACITSVFERDAHDHCGALGKKSDIHEPNPVSRSADRSIRRWKMSRCRERRDECLTCIHIFDRTRHVQEERGKESSLGDLKLFAQAHSPSASRSDATIPLPEYEPLGNN